MHILELAGTIPWKKLTDRKAAETWAAKADVKTLEDAVTSAKHHYYNEDEPLCTDAVYDAIESRLKALKPKSKALTTGAIVLDKAKLPIYMGSLDKIKDSTALDRFYAKNDQDEWIVMVKLDGISYLYVREKNGKHKLYTRGDGHYGKDISAFIPALRLPELKQGDMVRGELIMSEAKFEKAWREHFANARNMVAGITNRKDIHAAFKDVDAVAYEYFGYNQKAGLGYLKAKGFKVVQWGLSKTKPEFNELVEIHNTMKTASKYAMDGLVVMQVYGKKAVTSGNPGHAFAFKINDEENAPTVKVVAVHWRESRLGYIVPRIEIEPIRLQGVTVTYATAHNARNIWVNKIGPGAMIKIIRSGEVIPKIVEVVKPARKAAMPDVEYVWTDRDEPGDELGADIRVATKSDESAIRTAVHFFETVGVEGLQYASVKKFFDAGYKFHDFFDLGPDDYEELLGKNGLKIEDQVDSLLDDGVDLDTLLTASGLFDGIGSRRFTALVQAIPDLMTASKADVISRISEIPGWGSSMTNEFVKQFPTFRRWLKRTGIDYLVPKPKKRVTKGALVGQVVLFTGFRDAALADAIERAGGVMESGWKSTVTVVLATKPSAKTEAAEAKGVPVFTPDAFKRKYKISV